MRVQLCYLSILFEFLIYFDNNGSIPPIPCLSLFYSLSLSPLKPLHNTSLNCLACWVWHRSQRRSCTIYCTLGLPFVKIYNAYLRPYRLESLWLNGNFSTLCMQYLYSLWFYHRCIIFQTIIWCMIHESFHRPWSSLLNFQEDAWTCGDVCAWLEENGLGKYCTAFRERHIDGNTLASLTPMDLQRLGVQVSVHICSWFYWHFFNIGALAC